MVNDVTGYKEAVNILRKDLPDVKVVLAEVPKAVDQPSIEPAPTEPKLA